MRQSGGFGLYEITGSLLKGLSSIPKIVNKVEHFSKQKRKIMM